MKPLKNYYKTLGLAPAATAEQIKSAFRQLAKLHHPDGGSGNEGLFKEIAEAYSILGNDHKRKRYDEAMYLTGALQANKKNEAFDDHWLKAQLKELLLHITPISSYDLQEELTTLYIQHLLQHGYAQAGVHSKEVWQQSEAILHSLLQRLSFPYVRDTYQFLKLNKPYLSLDEALWLTLMASKKRHWQWNKWKPFLALFAAVGIAVVMYLLSKHIKQ